MNARQTVKVKMYRATEKHCDDNPTIIALNPAFQAAFNDFKTKIAAIISLTQQKDVGLKGIAVDKNVLKQTLCRLTSEIAGVIYAYAAASANNTLKQEVNFSLSTLLQTRDSELAPRCQNVHDRAQTNLADLANYGITTAHLTELQTAIDDYQSESPKPRTAVSQRSTFTANLADLFTAADTILREQMNNLIVTLKKDHPDFVKTYEANRIIIDAPTKLKPTTQPDISAPDDKPE